MSTYYKDTLSGNPIYRIAAARVTYEKTDGTIGELNLSGGGGGSSDWADITNKPAVIAAGATQAAARTAIGAIAIGDVPEAPTWSTISGKPAVVAGGTTQATARNSIGAAASGANSDITALSGLTTLLSVAQGGTGVGTVQALANGLGIGFMPPGQVAQGIGNIDTLVDNGLRALTATTVGRPTGTGLGDLVWTMVSGVSGVQVVFPVTVNAIYIRTYNAGTSSWRGWSTVTLTALA